MEKRTYKYILQTWDQAILDFLQCHGIEKLKYKSATKKHATKTARSKVIVATQIDKYEISYPVRNILITAAKHTPNIHAKKRGHTVIYEASCSNITMDSYSAKLLWKILRRVYETKKIEPNQAEFIRYPVLPDISAQNIIEMTAQLTK